MATYVELVLLGDNDKCRQVLTSMGWETKDEQDEVLEELADQCNTHYLVCYENTISKKQRAAQYEDFDILYTIGSEEGNRWYPVNIPGFRDTNGACWVMEQLVDEHYC